jgi:tRNA A-37 threonylcarbamoyl transferase component Bud32
MAAKVITEFKGHSGCGVFLMGKRGNLFVRKTGNFLRNIQQQKVLLENFYVPKIFNVTESHVDMEYIHGLDMRSFLIAHPANSLIDFLVVTIKKFAAQSTSKTYLDSYTSFLTQFNYSQFPFAAQELVDKLPAVVPSGLYHGDLTLENIIYNSNMGFAMIDCSVGIWDSYVFDLAKLRQDLHCKWFLRNNPAMLESKLGFIQNSILEEFPEANNDATLILMLMRVLRYCKVGDPNYEFLIKEINKLWK